MISIIFLGGQELGSFKKLLLLRSITSYAVHCHSISHLCEGLTTVSVQSAATLTSGGVGFVSTFKMRYVFKVIGFKEACQADGRKCC